MLIMLGQVVSLRLIGTSSICQKCAKLLNTHRTVHVRLKNNHTARNSEHSGAGNTRETVSELLEIPCNFVNHLLKYDPRSDVSWKLSKWPRNVTSPRKYGTTAAFNCRNYRYVEKSNFPNRHLQLGLNKCAFHTSSVHFDEETGKKTPGLNETNGSTQKLVSNEKANHSHNDHIQETGAEIDSQSDADIESVDVLNQANKVAQAKATANKAEHSNKTEEVAIVKSSDKGALSGEPAHFDSDKQIKEFLKEKEMVMTQGHTCFITSCPKLGKVLMKKQQKIEGERLFINSTSGHFLCEHCEKSGSWPVLKDNISALRKIRKKKEYSCFENVSVREEPQTTPPEVTLMLRTAQDIRLLKKEEFQDMIDFFDWQGIKQTTLTKFGAKYIQSGDTYNILLPVISVRGVVVGVRKFTATQKQTDDEETHNSVRVTSHPRHLAETFGWQSVNAKSTSIVITGSEVESLAIIQKTDIPSIALKNLTYFPQELLPYLERFTKIIMWFGNDVKAWQSSKQFAKKLNDLRCHVFRPNSDMLSPLEVIQGEESLKDMLLKARPIGHDSIVSFNKLRHEVYIELAQIEQVAGVKWKRYTPLNKILKGHRPGELTVLTGPTGSGKTTFVADYSLDLCTQGVNTLWGSFEISNVRLAKVMLSQFAGKSMMKNLKCFDEIADQFSDIPMFFMTYFGQEETQNVIKAMSHAVYVHDIKHVIVDNLQFMMGMNYAEGSRFHLQDKIISMFRKFATTMNCHVTLIIHPRKEKDGEELMMASIFGSAKAVQEADNVLILQDMRLTAASGRKYVQVMKNRFDGELGVMMLKFDKDSLRFVASQKKKSASRKKDEEEEKETADRTESGSKDSQDMKFKKLDESGHSYDHILDIDKYYST